MDDQGGDRRGSAGAGPLLRPLPALQLAWRGGLRRPAALGHALRVRRPSRKVVDVAGATMSNAKSDAFVFFGATGDLAYKKIFPALQAMVKRGHLDAPVIGVAKSGWTLDQFRARARDSVEQHGGLDARAFDVLCGLLRYVDGDYR